MVRRDARRWARGWTLAGGALLAAVYVGAVYRAATQSVVYDEAFSYLAFLSGSRWLVFTEFTANNHVLYTLLARLSIDLLGVSAFALRLPTLISAVVFLWASFSLMRRVLGEGHLAWLATAALALNPLLLDFLSAARGYGTALALFMGGMSMLTHAALGPPGLFTRRWAGASAALGLSACANLTFAVPSACLMMAALGIDVRRGGAAYHRSLSAYARQAVARGLIPGATLALVLLTAPLSRATAEHFFYGASSLEQTALSLIDASVHHGRRAWPADPLIIERDRTLLAIEWLVVVPLLVLAAWRFAAAVLFGAGRFLSSPPGTFAVLTGGTLLMTLIGVIGLHMVVGLPYPFGRTGLALIVLLIGLLAGLAGSARGASGGVRVRGVVFTTLLALAVARLASQFTLTYFHHWRYDAGTADFVAQVDRAQQIRGQPVRVAVAEIFEPTLEFYRVSRRLTEVAFVAGRWFDSPGAFDFFIVSPSAVADLSTDATVVVVHPVSGAVLMQNRRRRPP